MNDLNLSAYSVINNYLFNKGLAKTNVDAATHSGGLVGDLRRFGYTITDDDALETEGETFERINQHFEPSAAAEPVLTFDQAGGPDLKGELFVADSTDESGITYDEYLRVIKFVTTNRNRRDVLRDLCNALDNADKHITANAPVGS